MKRALIDLYSAAFQQNDQRRIHQNEGQRVHQGRQTSDSQLHPGQLVVISFIGRCFFLLHPKGTQHANTGHVFTGMQQHLIQLALHLLVAGQRQLGNAHHCQGQKGEQRQKDQRRPSVDGKGHDRRAEHHERGAQQQPQHHVHASLHLVHVRRHTVDERRSAEPVQISVGKALDMSEQRGLDIGGEAGSRAGSEVLRRSGRAEAQQAKPDQNQTRAEDVTAVQGHDALVDNRRHQQRNEKLQQRFQQLKQRGKDALLSVRFQKGKQGFHEFVSFYIWKWGNQRITTCVRNS